MKNKPDVTHRVNTAPATRLAPLGALALSMLTHCGAEVIGPQDDSESAHHEEILAERAEGVGSPRTGTFNLPGGRERLSYRLVEGHRMFQGDIALPASDEELANVDRSTLSAGQSLASFRWPDSVVVYRLQSDLPATTVTKINNAIAHWEQSTSIRFRLRTNESDYLEFSDDAGGCWSYVGYQSGIQTLNLSSGCSAGAAIHEIGHAVGLWHEQSRTDRNGFVVTDTDCVDVSPDDQRTNFDVLSSGVNYGLYDFDSIMHYDSSAFYTNEAVPSSCSSTQYTLWRRSSVGSAQDPINAQRTGLSFLDRQGIEEMYSQGMGQSVAVGDFNGDGYRDVALGAPRAETSGAGHVRVFRGSATGLVFTDELVAPGAVSEGRFGYALAAGDFNGDGFADLAVGEPGRSNRAGRVVVYNGRSDSAHLVGSAAEYNQTGLDSNETGDRFGFALSAGDINGDGFADLAVGAPGESLGSTALSSGAVSLFIGGRTALTAWRLVDQTGLDTNESGDSFGASVHLRDLDGDGRADLVVGAPTERDGSAPQGGLVYLFRGTISGVSAWRTLRPALGALNYNGQDMAFGFSLATGDIDGDGHRELVVGAPGATVTGTLWAGRVLIFRGSTSGPQAGWTTLVPASPVMGGAFGFSLAAARFNADTRADLAVGAPGARPSASAASGQVHTYMGTSSGITSSNVLSQAPLGVLEAGDRVGASVAVGDLDSDGDDDLVAGAPGERPGSGAQTGYGYVFRSDGAALNAWTTVAP